MTPDPCSCPQLRHALARVTADPVLLQSRCGWCVQSITLAKNELVRENAALARERDDLRGRLARLQYQTTQRSQEPG